MHFHGSSRASSLSQSCGMSDGNALRFAGGGHGAGNGSGTARATVMRSSMPPWYHLPMSRTSSADPLDEVPEFSPIDARYKIEDVATIEVHREVYDTAGHKRWKAVLGEWKPHTSLADIKAVGGGGTFRIQARRAGNKPLFTVTRMIDGRPRDSVDDDGDADGDAEETFNDDATKLVHETIRQQTAILPAAFTTLTQAMLASAASGAERGVAMAERMEAMVRTHASTLEGMRATHAAEIARREAEIARRDMRVELLEKKLDDLTGQNAGYLRTIAQGKSVNEYIAAFKEIVPELPKFADFAKKLVARPPEAAKALGEGATKKLTFGA